ncbi:plasmid pRiA4b ORF-3 family protein [Sutcliffiella horikoshii]
MTVPSGITFSKLRDVLQTAFSWQNSHIHDFEIFEKKQGGSGWEEKPSLNLVCHEEAFSYQGAVPMKMEHGYKLKDFTGSKIVYNYDFGDDWKHTIEVEDVIKDYTVNYPICTDGEGNAPPEDVGGEMGYEVFISILKIASIPITTKQKSGGDARVRGV